MSKDLNQEGMMKIKGLIVNKDLSNFRTGQVLLNIQNGKGKSIGVLNIQNSNLSESIKHALQTPQRIKISIETENLWK